MGYTPSQLTLSGKSYDEIINKLYQLYGNNYQIVDKKTDLKGGFLGLFQKDQITVKYKVIDRNSRESENFEESKKNILQKSGIDANAINSRNTNELLKKMEVLMGKMEEVKNATTTDIHPNIKKIEEILEMNEFSHSFISVITSKIRNELTIEETDNYELVERKVVDWIGSSIKIAPVIHRKAPHVVVLVGPTGVGKTTTTAKMAASIIVEAKKRHKENPDYTIPVIKMINTDKIRVGAEEQLKKYGEAMEVQVEKAEHSGDLITLYENWKNSVDYIFIDTSGYSPNDFENIGKMRALLDVAGISFDTYLTINASTKASDLTKIIQNYEVFNASSVIITKFDETTTYGNVLSILAEKGKSISWITDGQSVPRCIHRASVVEFLIHLTGFNIDRTHIEDLFPEEK